MKRFAFVLAITLILCSAVLACNPAAVVYAPVVHRQRAVYRSHGHYQQYYVAPVVKEIYYPAYRISFDDGSAKLAEALEKLNTTLEGMQLNAGNGAALTGQQVLATACAKCHRADKADEFGNGYVILNADGSLAGLSANDVKRIYQRLSHPDPAKRMPPGGSLNVQSLTAVKRMFDEAASKQ